MFRSHPSAKRGIIFQLRFRFLIHQVFDGCGIFGVIDVEPVAFQMTKAEDQVRVFNRVLVNTTGITRIIVKSRRSSYLLLFLVVLKQAAPGTRATRKTVFDHIVVLR